MPNQFGIPNCILYSAATDNRIVFTFSASAPGRLEILGNHTDYNRGVVLAAAIDRGATVSGTARTDDVITLRSEAFRGAATVRLAELRPEREQLWANYALGVVSQFLQSGYRVCGFDASVTGNIPIGAGLSSSAAFEVATACFLIKLGNVQMDALAVAKLCQRAENEFVGVRSGLLDQVTSVFGRVDHVVYLDCNTEEIRAVPFPPELAFVIAHSGETHDLLASRYNSRSDECAEAARALHVPNLRAVTDEQLKAAGTALDPLLKKRAAHVIGENNRVWRALEFLANGDAVGIGALMNASHESSRTNFENSTPKLDMLVEIARALPGVLGSRLTGGGFGGSTITLVEVEHAESVTKNLNRHYAAKTGTSANAFVCRIADGAAILHGLNSSR